MKRMYDLVKLQLIKDNKKLGKVIITGIGNCNDLDDLDNFESLWNDFDKGSSGHKIVSFKDFTYGASKTPEDE